jgi:hypothetical protein
VTVGHNLCENNGLGAPSIAYHPEKLGDFHDRDKKPVDTPARTGIKLAVMNAMNLFRSTFYAYFWYFWFSHACGQRRGAF